MEINTLYYGDCLEWMDRWNDRSVDLIYLDPPFNSDEDYNMLFNKKTLKDAQYRAFQDTWTWDEEAIKRYDIYKRAKGKRAHNVIIGLHGILGDSGMMAYLTYMAERLEHMYRLLKPTGAIYLHCDQTASHYLKILLDNIFGARNFRDEIVWKRCVSDAKGNQYLPKKWGTNTDTIFFYGMKDHRTRPYRKLSPEELEVKFPLIDEKDGRRYKDDSNHIWSTPGMGARPNLCYEWRGYRNPHPSGWRLKKERLEEEYQKGSIIIHENGRLERRAYEEDYRGEPIGNLWTDINPVMGKEDIGRDTQKPEELLRRIIMASSDKESVILDPFCGCGTTIAVARDMGRKWVGIDISSHAIDLIKEVKLKDKTIATKGIPYDFASAQKLAKDSPFNFESWAVTRLPGFVPNTKQTADGGVDGRATLAIKPDDYDSDLGLAQVKGGQKFNLSSLRDFIHVSDSKKAALGYFITLNRVTTQNARREVLKKRTISIRGNKFQRIQLWSIDEYFENRWPQVPLMNDPYTGNPLRRNLEMFSDMPLG